MFALRSPSSYLSSAKLSSGTNNRESAEVVDNAVDDAVDDAVDEAVDEAVDDAVKEDVDANEAVDVDVL